MRPPANLFATAPVFPAFLEVGLDRPRFEMIAEAGGKDRRGRGFDFLAAHGRHLLEEANRPAKTRGTAAQHLGVRRRLEAATNSRISSIKPPSRILARHMLILAPSAVIQCFGLRLDLSREPGRRRQGKRETPVSCTSAYWDLTYPVACKEKGTRSRVASEQTLCTDSDTDMHLPLKWHGGKYYLAPKIVHLMPPHLHYVEPFFGGGAVLLAREPENPAGWLFPNQGVSEVVNDVHDRLINFWRVLQGEETFAAFQRKVEAIPLSRAAWEEAHEHVYGQDAIADAVAFFVDCRQSRSGLMTGFTSVSAQPHPQADEWECVRVVGVCRRSARGACPAAARAGREAAGTEAH